MEFVKTYDKEVQAYAGNIILDFYKAEKEDDFERMEEIADLLGVYIGDLQNVTEYLVYVLGNPDFDTWYECYLKVMDAIEDKAHNA